MSLRAAARPVASRFAVVVLILALSSAGAVASASAAPVPARHAPGARSSAAASPAATSLAYLQLAESGAAAAQLTWRDRRRGWYDEVLHDHARYPLATIWGIVPLFETLDAVAIASPTPAHRAAVVRFARGAERYFNPGLRPTPGFAPYPGDRGQPRTWFDDNGWWGLAFMDAYRATQRSRYLHDAQKAFAFIAAQGWDRRHGGMWWNTSHPYRSGPALASDTLLGALLYQQTGNRFYLAQVQRYLAWADTSFLTDYRLYAQNDSDGTPTPYVEGPMVEAHEILCKLGQAAACARATQLADSCWRRFEERLNMGPQFDTIYLHWMLAYGAQAADGRWSRLAQAMAAQARDNALMANGLYLRAWDGGPITAHEARPNMLQTHAATSELFAWLAAFS